jgi:hypothetical protein
MTDDEAIALRVTAIAGHSCADDFLVTWPGMAISECAQ